LPGGSDSPAQPKTKRYGLCRAGRDSPVMEPGDRDALGDILTAIRGDQGFPIPDRETFLASAVHQDAVMRNLEIIGEATHREIAGMRDVLIHAYDRVDLGEVWITLSEQLPALLVIRANAAGRASLPAPSG